MLGLVQKKNRPEKFSFIVTKNWIVLAIRWSVKHFLPQIPQYSGKVATKKKKQKKAIVKRYAFYVNAKSDLLIC